MLNILTSAIDGSINHIYPDGSEFRLARRPDHDSLYLSSHIGCGLGCGFCHLTTTRQTRMVPLSRAEMLARVGALIPQAKGRINFAFMSRGDALMNPEVDWRCIEGLQHAAGARVARVNISTIFPRTVVGKDVAEFLFERFGAFQPTLYWSLYSLDPKVRETWMPNAADPDLIVEGLQRWQAVTMQEVVIHHALIAGVNDRAEDAKWITGFLNGLRYRVNLVRYNAPDARSHEASDAAYSKHLAIYGIDTRGRARVIERVGYDAYASCGMFVPRDEIGPAV